MEGAVMKTLLTGFFAGVMVCGISLAQGTTPPQTNDNAQLRQQSPLTTQSGPSSSKRRAGEAPRIAPGSIIPVQLTKSIDAKKVKSGDEVEAKVTQDLKTGNGEVVVPKDTKVVGHVTEAQPRSKEQKESEVGIAFDHAVTMNGTDVPLPMSIEAIIAPAALNPDAAAAPAPSAPSAGGVSPGNSGGRSTGMGAGTPSASMPGGEWPTNTQNGTDAHQPITGNTQGVVGISNLQLSMIGNKTEGSIVSSEKSNVRLDSGTLMLLRVNP
jgi:hypothetical protein